MGDAGDQLAAARAQNTNPVSSKKGVSARDGCTRRCRTVSLDQVSWRLRGHQRLDFLVAVGAVHVVLDHLTDGVHVPERRPFGGGDSFVLERLTGLVQADPAGSHLKNPPHYPHRGLIYAVVAGSLIVNETVRRTPCGHHLTLSRTSKLAASCPLGYRHAVVLGDLILDTPE